MAGNFRKLTNQEAKALRLTIAALNDHPSGRLLYSVCGCSADANGVTNAQGPLGLRCDAPNWTFTQFEPWEETYNGRLYLFALCHCHNCEHSNRIGIPIKPEGAA